MTSPPALSRSCRSLPWCRSDATSAQGGRPPEGYESCGLTTTRTRPVVIRATIGGGTRVAETLTSRSRASGGRSGEPNCSRPTRTVDFDDGGGPSAGAPREGVQPRRHVTQRSHPGRQLLELGHGPGGGRAAVAGGARHPPLQHPVALQDLDAQAAVLQER